jgi:hypothetical protein
MARLSKRQLVLFLTTLVVAALAALFAWLGPSEAERLAIVVTGLAAVAAVGVAGWAALPGGRSAGVRVSHTGPARAGKGGIATSGLSGTAHSAGPVEVEHTGSAKADEGGKATSGIYLDGSGQD